MEARELRIGNYIDFGHPYGADTVESIDAVYCQVTKKGDYHYERKVSELFPIRLNEEWLLKFGFSNGNKELLNCDLWNKHWIGDFEIEKDGEEYIYGSVTAFKYVHQLQNLYYALTGEELKINNK